MDRRMANSSRQQQVPYPMCLPGLSRLSWDWRGLQRRNRMGSRIRPLCQSLWKQEGQLQARFGRRIVDATSSNHRRGGSWFWVLWLGWNLLCLRRRSGVRWRRCRRRKFFPEARGVRHESRCRWKLWMGRYRRWQMHWILRGCSYIIPRRGFRWYQWASLRGWSRGWMLVLRHWRGGGGIKYCWMGMRYTHLLGWISPGITEM